MCLRHRAFSFRLFFTGKSHFSIFRKHATEADSKWLLVLRAAGRVPEESGKQPRPAEVAESRETATTTTMENIYRRHRGTEQRTHVGYLITLPIITTTISESDRNLAERRKFRKTRPPRVRNNSLAIAAIAVLKISFGTGKRFRLKDKGSSATKLRHLKPDIRDLFGRMRCLIGRIVYD